MRVITSYGQDLPMSFQFINEEIEHLNLPESFKEERDRLVNELKDSNIDKDAKYSERELANLDTFLKREVTKLMLDSL